MEKNCDLDSQICISFAAPSFKYLYSQKSSTVYTDIYMKKLKVKLSTTKVYLLMFEALPFGFLVVQHIHVNDIEAAAAADRALLLKISICSVIFVQLDCGITRFTSVTGKTKLLVLGGLKSFPDGSSPNCGHPFFPAILFLGKEFLQLVMLCNG